MFGFRMAYDWYLKTKLESQKKSPRFRQKRTSLAHCFADYIYPEFAAHERISEKLELARTIRSLQRGLASTINRGSYLTHLENYLSGSSVDHVARREVCCLFLGRKSFLGINMILCFRITESRE